MGAADKSEEQKESSQKDGIVTPHDHDVLSGRGNFVNNHPGNEHFRSLVKTHKVAYVSTPKSQKPKYSKLIVEAIRSLDPPGRFLKQDEKTKLWHEIDEKKALDKTRQALREGAPELTRILTPDAPQPNANRSPTNTSNNIQANIPPMSLVRQQIAMENGTLAAQPFEAAAGLAPGLSVPHVETRAPIDAATIDAAVASNARMAAAATLDAAAATISAAASVSNAVAIDLTGTNPEQPTSVDLAANGWSGQFPTVQALAQQQDFFSVQSAAHTLQHQFSGNGTLSARQQQYYQQDMPISSSQFVVDKGPAVPRLDENQQYYHEEAQPCSSQHKQHNDPGVGTQVTLSQQRLQYHAPSMPTRTREDPLLDRAELYSPSASLPARPHNDIVMDRRTQLAKDKSLSFEDLGLLKRGPSSNVAPRNMSIASLDDVDSGLSAMFQDSLSGLGSTSTMGRSNTERGRRSYLLDSGEGMSFSGLLDFNESYNPSFKFDDTTEK